MQSAVRLSAWVKPGGRLEVANDQLPVGKSVDVIVLFSSPPEAARPSVVDVLAEAPGHLMFQTTEEVDAYLREERDAWDR
jgi:hypothetical protein